MSPDATSFIATSIASSLLPRLRRTHKRRRIGVFAGPPGIGKSTALEAFRAEEEWNVGLVSVPPGPKGGLMPTAAMHLAAEALRGFAPRSYSARVPNGYIELRNRLFSMVSEWAGFQASEVRRDGLDPSEFPPLTLIFDEAQNLSRDAIEMLRFANDATGGFSPLPLGLIFVGNNEFVLKTDRGGPSVLSAAVADRALYTETFSYSDVSDDDLTLFFEASGIVDPKALQMVVRHFSAGRSDRSFRRAADLAAELSEEAAGAAITPDVVRDVLSLA